MGIGRPLGIGLALVVTALALLGSFWWFMYGSSGDDVEPASASSATALVGSWKLQDGAGQIVLTGDGRFTATALPDEVFRYGSDSTFTGAGRWSLADGGRSVQLTASAPAAPSDWADGASLSVVSDGGGLQLCVDSGAPGVLCDYVLQRGAR